MLLLAVVVSLPGNGNADPLIPFKPGSSKVDFRDVLPHFDLPENRRNEFYSEWWSFVFRLEDGCTAYIQFLISNTGPGDGKATVKTNVKLADGRQFSDRTNLDEGEWSWNKERFEIRFGPNIAYGPLDGLRVKLQNPSFQADFEISNIAAPWKPGTARAQYGTSDNRYYRFHYIVPVGRVEGTIRIPGEEATHKVKGLVHVDHSVASVGLHVQARRMARFRALDEKVTFLATDMITPEQYGSAPIRFAVLFVDGKPVLETVDFKIQEGETYTDTRKSGYSFPRLLEISGSTSDGSFRGAIKATKSTGREDYLESAGRAARFVIARFAKPMMYYFDGVFALRVQTGGESREFKGKGSYYFTIVNP
jgi:hypothetical protein